jgi:hypothetical protein
VTVKSRAPRRYDDFWNGPVRTIRSLLAFMAERRLVLRHVSAMYGPRGNKRCVLHGLGAGGRPKRLRRQADQEFLFTFRGVDVTLRKQVADGWTSLVTSEKLLPVWALYSAATEEQRLHTETRFLMLAQALETYHRTMSTDTRIPADVQEVRRKRVLDRLDPEDVSWVTEALAWSNQLTLRMRLEALYRDVPRPLIDHLRNRAQLPDQIKNTRNF